VVGVIHFHLKVSEEGYLSYDLVGINSLQTDDNSEILQIPQISKFQTIYFVVFYYGLTMY